MYEESENSTNCIHEGKCRQEVRKLLNHIRDILNHSFHVVSTDQSIIMEFKVVINKLSPFIEFLYPAERYFFVGLKLFSNILLQDIGNVDKSLVAINVLQQEYDVCQQLLDVKHVECVSRSKSIGNLLLRKLSADQFVQQKIVEEVEALTMAYNASMATIIDGHKRRKILQSQLSAAQEQYEHHRQRIPILKEAWQNLQAFQNI